MHSWPVIHQPLITRPRPSLVSSCRAPMGHPVPATQRHGTFRDGLCCIVLWPSMQIPAGPRPVPGDGTARRGGGGALPGIVTGPTRPDLLSAHASYLGTFVGRQPARPITEALLQLPCPRAPGEMLPLPMPLTTNPWTPACPAAPLWRPTTPVRSRCGLHIWPHSAAPFCVLRPAGLPCPTLPDLTSKPSSLLEPRPGF